jgi:ATP/maltotriose-dependent transcriptional regulator MalT
MAQVQAPWSARVDVFRRYDADAGNVRQVLSQCLAARAVEAGLRIAVAVSPCWIVRGTFGEGAEWLDSFLALTATGVPAAVQGAARVVRAQLALSRDPAAAEAWGEAGLALCRAAGDQFWTAAALNLLAEIALHTGRAADATSCAAEALEIAQRAGDGWNEGYALGTRAAIAGLVGKLREAQHLAKASLIVMRRIDQQWGSARTLLGLADLARLRGDPREAHHRYTDALAILREIDARPEIARCLAGLGRVALEQGALGPARQHFTESLRLSHSTGTRIGVARGLAAFATLAAGENRPELAVQLTAAAAALRKVAGLPALSGARIDRYLAAARRLGEPAVARLWAEGEAMGSEAAVALALAAPHPAAAGGAPAAGLTGATVAHVAEYQPPTALPGTLTPREGQVAALVAAGLTNKAIAGELVISPATAARHVANILAKLGFSSRAQIAVWAMDKQAEIAGPAVPPVSAQHA